MKDRLQLFHDDCSAVTAIEYALIGALIAAVIIVAVTTMGTQLQALYTMIRDRIVQVAQ